MNYAVVSVLHHDARTRAGARSSAIVVGRSQLTADLITSTAWSPTLYAGTRRAATDFVEAQVVGFDIDEGLSLAEAVARFAHYAHIIGTTTNHQRVKNEGTTSQAPACDRFRLILFLEEPVTSAADYKLTLATLAQELDIPMDEGAKDAARWFIPCREVVSYNMDGLHVPITRASQQPASAAAPSPKTTVALKGRLSRATIDFLAQQPSDEPWHMRFFKAAVDLKEQGYDSEEAEQRLRLASPVMQLDETDLKQLEDVYLNRGGALDVRLDWPAMAPSKTGEMKPVPSSPANQRYLLTEVLGHTFKANKRREVIYYTTREQPAASLPLTDTTLASLNVRAREYGIQAGDSLRDLIIDLAQENAYDPILEPLEALEWDGEEHIAHLFETIRLPAEVTAEQRLWYYTFLRRWLIGVVTKVYRPGSENNVLVFQGEQAAGKSRWLKRLAQLWPEGYGEGHVSPDNKDHELRHIDNFIWHVAEFDSTTSRREVGALKDYFTKDQVTVRRPYARLPTVGASICSFCASVNSFEFLHDATGNRRYLVIPVSSIDANHEVSIPQVFAEAKAAMLAGERQWFSREEINEVNKLNDLFLAKEDYLEQIEARCKPGEQPYTVKEIMDVLGFEDVYLARPIKNNIRSVLEKNGIRRTTLNGRTVFRIDSQLLGRRESTLYSLTAKQLK